MLFKRKWFYTKIKENYKKVKQVHESKKKKSQKCKTSLNWIEFQLIYNCVKDHADQLKKKKEKKISNII